MAPVRYLPAAIVVGLYVTAAAQDQEPAVPAVDLEVRLAVIGMPGHGKSTFLNAIANDKKAFSVGSGAGSHTKQVSQKSFDLHVPGAARICVTLVDTMGFPDPDPGSATIFYDQVVEAVSQPLHAIVWVVKMERKLGQTVSAYRALMREFNKAKPQIIMVVNGMENYEDDQERRERKQHDLQKGEEFGRALASDSGVSVSKIIVGAERQDLKGKVRQELALALLGAFPQASALRTYAELQREYLAAEAAGQGVQYEVRNQELLVQKIDQDIREVTFQLAHRKTVANAALAIVPILGTIVWAVYQDGITRLEYQLDRLKDERREAQSALAAMQSDASVSLARYDNTRQTFLVLHKALTGGDL